MGTEPKCGRVVEEGQPPVDCTGKGTWSDGTLFDSSLVPDMPVVLDSRTPARFIPEMRGVDDKTPAKQFSLVCELACIKI